MHEPEDELSRRSVLKGIAVAGAGVAIASCSSSANKSTPSTTVPSGGGGTTTAPPSTVPKIVRKPGSRPNPTLPEGTDTMPKIEHIVIVMMENHSFDGR